MTPLRLGMLVAFVVQLASSSLHAGEEQAWGDVKGQVVWGGDKLPEPKMVNIGRGNALIVGKGPLLPDPLFMVDKKTKGVRWVMVWLVDKDRPKDPNVSIPIHPCLKPVQEEIIIDQSCCQYDPPVFGIQVGQTVVFKNRFAIAHNVKMELPLNQTPVGVLIPPNPNPAFKNFKPTKATPILFSCAIHPWMTANARVFNHPYFTVTNAEGEFILRDAPAGTFRLMGWHPEVGWLTGREGKEITITADQTTDLGKILLKPIQER